MTNTRFASGHNMDEVEPRNRLTVRPAASEISRPIKAVVERTSEMKIICNQRLDRQTILIDISAIARAYDRDRIILHLGHLRSSATYHGAQAFRRDVPHCLRSVSVAPKSKAAHRHFGSVSPALHMRKTEQGHNRQCRFRVTLSRQGTSVVGRVTPTQRKCERAFARSTFVS